MEGIEIVHLRAFVALADHRHFGKAATELGIAQPGLSKRIAAFEERLGVQLFERKASGKSLRLTRAGDMLYRTAPGVLERFEDAIEQCKRAATGKAGLLRLGYSSLAMATVLPSALANQRAAFPELSIQLHEGNSEALCNGLLGDRHDLAFPLQAGTSEEDLSELSHRVVHRSPVGIVLPRDHNLANSDSPVPIHRLANEPLILFPRRMNPILYDDTLAACLRAGFHPNIVGERSPREAAIAEVAAGNGITFLTGALKHLVIEGTTHRELCGESVPSIQVFASWMTDKSPLIIPWLQAMFPDLDFPAS